MLNVFEPGDIVKIGFEEKLICVSNFFQNDETYHRVEMLLCAVEKSLGQS